jgi:hypothetical protein
MMTPAPHEKETRDFDRHLNQWRASHIAQYVLIKEEAVIGFYPSLSEAKERLRRPAPTDRYGTSYPDGDYDHGSAQGGPR